MFFTSVSELFYACNINASDKYTIRIRLFIKSISLNIDMHVHENSCSIQFFSETDFFHSGRNFNRDLVQ